MDRKENQQFPETTEEEKGKISAGSPVTIGGGLTLVKEAYIKFVPEHWECDCKNGLLTFKGDGNVDAIYMEDGPPPGTRRIPHATVEELYIWFKL
jgi:hypothetical protein